MNGRRTRNNMRAFALYTLSFGVIISSTETLVRAATSTPNVLVVVLDDVGWQDVGFHDDNFHTPHIDKLVSEGIELTAFYASPECTPARSQLMTGRYNYKVSAAAAILLYISGIYGRSHHKPYKLYYNTLENENDTKR